MMTDDNLTAPSAVDPSATPAAEPVSDPAADPGAKPSRAKSAKAGTRSTAGTRSASNRRAAAGRSATSGTRRPARRRSSPMYQRRIPITDIAPVIECGRYPAKCVVGEPITISATVFREGHAAVGANLVLIDPAGAEQPWTPMRLVAEGTDRYAAEVTPDGPGMWSFRIEAWDHPIETWRREAEIKIPLGQDVDLVCEEGARLYEEAAEALADPERKTLLAAAAALRSDDAPAARLATALAPEVLAVLERYPLRRFVTTSPAYSLQVDRPRALVGAWYEFFPRSEGASLDPPRSGTFATAARRLPAIAAMGFDVVYLPPIHPIGTTFRKGRNNSLHAEPGDPGVPWAIGSPEGGHDAVHPDLGTLADFDAFVATARDLGLEIALDFALQCSPDHPWVREHPEWFTRRPDGSIAYAENPPKKYQDIYPLNFDNDYEGLYAEVKRVLHHWMAHGVRIFRVDNPHTKPLAFWEELLADIRSTDPDVIFLSEAFTRPAMMRALAKVGFHQSYTYFTWRTSRPELESYLWELSHETCDYLRPNLFVNTPDILHAYLQHGGPPAFKIRAVIAAMAGPSWGVYSGYELCENTPLHPGSEEYLDSEKYQYKPRDWEAAEREGRSLAGYLATLNRIRREHVALQRLRNFSLHSADNPEILTFSKRATTPAGHDDTVLVVVNLNPFHTQEATIALDMPALGLGWDDRFRVVDLLSGAHYDWGHFSYVRLDPQVEPAHILVVQR